MLASDTETVEYIHSMIRQLRQMARSANLDTVEYLLAVTEREADQNLKLAVRDAPNPN